MTVAIGGSEFPVLCCLQSVVGEISAWPGRNKFSPGYVSRGVGVNTDGYTHLAVNCPECAFGNVWQDLTNDLCR